MKITTLEDLKTLQEAWSRGGQAGGRARADKLSKRKLREIARKGGLARAARAKAA